MTKVGWNLCARKDDLWARVIRAKYKCGDDVLSVIDSKRNGTNLWKGIVKTSDTVKSNLIWLMRNGRRIRFMEDCWVLSQGTLSQYKPLVLGKVEMFQFSFLLITIGNETLPN